MNLFNKNSQVEYSKEELTKIGKDNEREVILGENGKLLIINNNLFFQSDKDSIQIPIRGKEIYPNNIRNKTFYSTSIGIIYTSQKYQNGPLTSILFNLAKLCKKNEKDIKISGNFKTNYSSYEYDITKINKNLLIL